jgi:5-formyltetrahydrofolate cyclo-ligase
MRAKRRALSATQQQRHSQGFLYLLRQQRCAQNAQRIAAYLAADGELDIRALFSSLRRQHKQLYLPVLRPHPQMKLWFAEDRGKMSINRFGILEPVLTRNNVRPPWALDIILVPLVAFDTQCNRIGMGGGFYDRTLAYLRHRKHWRRPRLIGVAHECQKAEQLPTQDWDVPLDMVISESQVYRRVATRSEPGNAYTVQPAKPANSR